MDGREQLLAAIEDERERIIAFFRDFVRCETPNPPGDTTTAVRHITDFLAAEGVPWRLVDPEPSMANVVGSIEGAGPGRHLVLNGHIDVFPIAPDPVAEGWTTDPWGGEIRDGKLYGRGSADMKAVVPAF
ncbi:MAG: M20/M25/M40 family metallo-hydrolase, partial [Pseudomonadota bacterium]